MRFFATALIFCGVIASKAQTPPVRILVPERIQFAGMTLTLGEDVRAEIQVDVDALTQSPKYFNIKAERAKTYFPTIERIFIEERVPTDFKFLVLQESALIADAVSETDAVGFWQFKDFTASEMGLRVDKVVDERMNIVSSTRAAARYIKQNNYMFNNWVYALQAYQMGAGGVKRMVGDEQDGSRSMDITLDTYWYVKKYLAHKVAFEEAVRAEGLVKISEVEISSGASLAEIASRASIEESKLREFNKWIRGSTIPDDRSYVLVIPTGNLPQDFSVLQTARVSPRQETQPARQSDQQGEVLINDIPVIQAQEGETLDALAARSGLDRSQFLRYNELSADHQVVTGGYYFKAKKKSRTEEQHHTLMPGEDLWFVSQLYGVHVRRLRKYNHLGENEQPSAGAVIWLNSNKPRSSQMTDAQSDVVTVDESFVDWAGGPGLSEHVVKAGETLYSISRQYNTTVDQLRKANQLETNDLTPGQILRIEGLTVSATEPASGIIHEVKQAETLYSVAKRYGVSVKELMESNNKTDFTVALGEKLRIPSR
jgi:membrane-bound lytic murein transglycosylase D